MRLKILTTTIIMLISIISFGQTKKSTPIIAPIKKVQGSMTLSDGMLNGQKTMLSKAQVLGDIEYLVTEGEAGRLPVVIIAEKNKINMVAKFVNANFEVIITQPLTTNAQGYLITTGRAIKTHKDTGTIGGKTTTKKVTLAKKHDYVGHVTLLR
jgi:hypothetical protein